MRLARKLFLLAAMALAALALTANTAAAQVEVFEEEADGDDHHCLPLAVESPHEVHGGCHFEVESEVHIPLVVQTAGGPVVISNCNVHLEARIAENGVGYVVEADLTDEVPPTNPPCTRAACDEAAPSHAMLPWPLSIVEVGGVESVESTFCLRTIASGEGGAGTNCEVHLPLIDMGQHRYEIGAGAGSSYACENPLLPVSIRNVHFVNEVQGPGEPKEDIEIVH